MTTTRQPTRQEMYRAQASLKSRGWQHIASVIIDRRVYDDDKFGLLYVRGVGATRQEFWLNLNTINSLPEGTS